MADKKLAKKSERMEGTAAVLRRHFSKYSVTDLVTARREYPIPARVDLQRAITAELTQFADVKQYGVHVEYSHETLTLGHLLGNVHAKAVVGPLEYQQVDIGEPEPVACVVRSLWLVWEKKFPFVVILGPAHRFGQPGGMSLEIALPAGETGAELSRRLIDRIDERIKCASSYRGRVISLEQTDHYRGVMGAIRIHKLKPVERHEVILPAKTLALLDRNVIGFVQQRDKLRSMRLPTKKGLLFHGPPGTGKTHTIQYLASKLPDHTTLLVTAEQVGILDHYFQLARFLQPAMLVIEDADLIARSREHMGGACEEAMLNKLLNEMDGLREDADILFILSTNRPESLEAALAARPGRVDQAIEFPLPDGEGRRQLALLYASGMDLQPEVLDRIAARTEGASAALIKELMRRSAQYMIESGADHLSISHVDSALEEMLFGGGYLNAALLGGAAVVGKGSNGRQGC